MPSEPAPQLPIRELPAVDAPPHPRMPRPKLSIAHLMLWTLGTAVVLALWRTQFSFLEDSRGFPSEFPRSDELSTFLRFSAIISAPFGGVSVALLLVVVGRLYRHQTLPLNEPGHWILLVSGATIALNACMHSVHYVVFEYLVFDAHPLLHTLSWQVPQGMSFLVAAALYFLARYKTPEPPRWRFYFLANMAMMVLAAVVPVVFTTLQWAEGDVSALTLSAMVLGLVSIPFVIGWMTSFPLAVGRDLWLNARRDALHWAGISMVIVDISASIANPSYRFRYCRCGW